MLTQVGRSRKDGGDAVDLLVECHTRIRHFTAVTRRLAEARDASPEEIREAAAGVHRYFTTALPLHARDEEESLVPRLRGLDPAIDQALDEMSREHELHGDPLARVVDLCAVLRDEPARQQSLAADLSGAVMELERQFIAHLDREEAVIFPAIRRLLAPDVNAAIVSELRARRQPGGSGCPSGDTPPG
jgi:iron-sulfur cluster repair protein YtfE (RIC family)